MKSKTNIYFIFVLLAASLWGTAGLFVRTAKNLSFDEMQLVLGRAFISSFILGLIIVLKDIKLFKINLKDIWIFALAGLMSIVLFNYSYYKTMTMTSLSVAAVLLYTAPFFVVIISRFLFGEKITNNKFLALMVAFLGCCFVSGLFDSAQRISAKALYYGLLTGFGYALYTIFSEILIKKGYKTLTITFYVFFFAAIFTLPFINISKTAELVLSAPSGLITVALMALINTVLPYLFYTTGLKGVEPSAAPVIATVEPVVATVIGAIVFNEALTINTVVGIILVLGSVMILNRKSVTVKANAKINLALAIKGKREDGYHLIDTVMQSICLADKIKVSYSKKIRVICNIKGLPEQENIAFKAATLFFEKTGILGGAKIYINKKIPDAAGLGGGSADAAAVLIALNKIYNTALSNQTLCEWALMLGADVPFFIEGGTARAEGIGEILTKLTDLKKVYIVLAKTQQKKSTKQMYQTLDNMPLTPINIDTLVEKINAQSGLEEIYGLLENSFEICWEQDDLAIKLKKLGANAVSLSGSGPTCFGIFESRKAAKRALASLKKQKINCYLTKTTKNSIIIE